MLTAAEVVIRASLLAGDCTLISYLTADMIVLAATLYAGDGCTISPVRG